MSDSHDPLFVITHSLPPTVILSRRGLTQAEVDRVVFLQREIYRCQAEIALLEGLTPLKPFTEDHPS